MRADPADTEQTAHMVLRVYGSAVRVCGSAGLAAHRSSSVDEDGGGVGKTGPLRSRLFSRTRNLAGEVDESTLGHDGLSRFGCRGFVAA